MIFDGNDFRPQRRITDRLAARLAWIACALGLVLCLLIGIVAWVEDLERRHSFPVRDERARLLEPAPPGPRRTAPVGGSSPRRPQRSGLALPVLWRADGRGDWHWPAPAG